MLMLVQGHVSTAQLNDAVKRLESCKDLKANVCMNAAATLKLAGDRSVGPIGRRLSKMTRPGQMLAMTVLGEHRSHASTRQLIKVAQNRRLPAVVRSMAFGHLTHRASRSVTAVLIRASTEKDVIVRIASVAALGNRPHRGDKRVLAALAKASKDEDPRVRTEALMGLSLARAGGEALTAALDDESADVRRAAADGLGRVEYTPAVEPLIEALQSQDAVLRQHVGKALEHQTGKNFGQDWALWREWYRAEGRQRADKGS